MNDEELEVIINKLPRVPYHTVIRIEIKGKAPAKTGELPYLPISFFEYIKDLINSYETNPYFKKNYEGLFTLVSIDKEEIKP